MHLVYLAAQFNRMDLLIRREVRRWVVAGQDPNDDYRGMYVTQNEAELLLDRPFGASWGQWVELPAEEEAALHSAYTQATEKIDAIVQEMAEQGATPKLLQLARNFDLDPTALDILLLCIAPAFDTKYERLYGYLQDNVTRRRPSVRLILDLLGEPGVDKFTLAPYLGADAPLFRHGLLDHVIEPPPANAHWLNQTLHADETVIAWLRGHYEHHGLLGAYVSLTEPDVNDTDLMLTGNSLKRSGPWNHDVESPIIAFYGRDQARQNAAARILAQQNGQALLTVDLNPVVDEQTSALHAVQAALRDARLTSAVAYLRGWEACADSNKCVSPDPFAAVCAHPGAVILASTSGWQPGGTERSRSLRWHEFDTPEHVERQVIWRHYLNGSGDAFDDETIDTLAGQFSLISGKIRDAVATARDEVNGQWSMGDKPPPLAVDALFRAARAYSNPRLSRLARKIEPRFKWDDIILPANQTEILHELVATVRQRSKVLEEWGVGKKLASSAGVTVLFAGPPGTGKTMAAEVIASDLGLDLYKIDLSSVVSKYIGETEKNLERIFSEAASSNAILFFDEADSLFGKRTETKDAHDRYANLEISYLLQRMEAYDGVTILATNLRANLDEAFTRRLHFAVDFPFPRVDDRLRIWQTLFPPDVPRNPELDFESLAQRYELAGGNIRNIIVSAAYLAADNGQVVSIEHLLHGAKRELQKMGRLVDEGKWAT